MKLKKDSAVIEIYPDKNLAASIIWNEFEIKRDHTTHYQIFEQLGDIVFDQITLPDFINYFNFNGVQGKEFKNSKDVKQFEKAIKALVKETNDKGNNLKINNIDDILFFVLLYDGFQRKLETSNRQSKYSDDLINVFTSLAKRKVTADYEPTLDDKEISFDKLQKEDKEIFIINDANCLARMVGVKNVMHYISDEFDVILKSRKSEHNHIIRSGNDTIDDIVLPNRLSKKILNIVLEEIFLHHKKYDTEFNKELCDDAVDILKLENRYTHRNFKKRNLILYNLINTIETYLDDINSIRLLKKIKWAFIHDLFKILGLLESKCKSDSDKYQKIREIVREYDPEMKKKLKGESQFF